MRFEDETVWLTQSQMVELFQSTKQNISLHIRNIFLEGELERNSTVKEYLTVQVEGGRRVNRKMAVYNLDVIISVGYRVKSIRGTRFRIWANQVLKDYMLKGYAVNERIDHIEKKLNDHDQKFDLKKFNAQYPAIAVKIFSKSHDRFLIIDKSTIYHLGASLKDLGKKWFAFSKIEHDPLEIISKLP